MTPPGLYWAVFWMKKGASPAPPPGPPDNVVTYNGDPVTYNGDYVTYD